MTANITLSEANHEDLPAMVAITCDAMAIDVLTHFLYSHHPADAARKQTESLMASLGKRFTHPTNRCYMHKATDPQTGDIVGWSLVRWEDGSWTTANNPASLQDDGSARPDFPVYYQREARKNWKDLTAGQPHVVLGALYVRPDRQRQGVGRQLVDYLYSEYALDKELVIVQTRAMSEAFYHRLGWTTANSTDIDLSEWAPSAGLGYGLHRSPQMLRHPKLS